MASAYPWDQRRFLVCKSFRSCYHTRWSTKVSIENNGTGLVEVARARTILNMSPSPHSPDQQRILHAASTAIQTADTKLRAALRPGKSRLSMWTAIVTASTKTRQATPPNRIPLSRPAVESAPKRTRTVPMTRSRHTFSILQVCTMVRSGSVRTWGKS